MLARKLYTRAKSGMAAGCTRVGKGEGSQNMYEEGAQMTQLQATQLTLPMSSKGKDHIRTISIFNKVIRALMN